MKEELTVQYHLDEAGRTVVTPLDENKQPRKFSFVLDEDPQIKARWSLTPLHDLKLTLAGEEGKEQELLLQGEIIAVEAEGLAFSFGFQDKEGQRHIRVLKFGGAWYADEQNRLSFKVARRNGAGETLTLDGLWEIGDRHEILYQYQRKDLKGRVQDQHKLVFKGKWELSERDTLSYLLEGSSELKFRFRVMLTDTRIVAGVGAIQFQVGIDVGARNLPHIQDVTLFGKWKIGPDFSVTFSMTYEEGHIDEWRFGARYQIASKTEIAFNLFGSDGNPLGIEVIFSKKLLQSDGEVYIKLRQAVEETAVEGGIRFLWGWLLVVLAAVLAATATATVWAEEPTAQPVKLPKAQVAEPAYDFGRVPAGQNVKHVYEVGNAGEGDLTISNVATSCGCTSALLDQPVVTPGGKARIQAIFNTHGRSGEQTKIITFNTNDPANQKMELKLSGKIQAPLVSSPEFVFFTGGEANKTARQILVQNYTFPGFALMAIRSSNPSVVAISDKPLGTPAAFHYLSVSINKDYPRERIFETLAVFTNDPLQPVVWIPVWGRRG